MPGEVTTSGKRFEIMQLMMQDSQKTLMHNIIMVINNACYFFYFYLVAADAAQYEELKICENSTKRVTIM